MNGTLPSTSGANSVRNIWVQGNAELETKKIAYRKKFYHFQYSHNRHQSLNLGYLGCTSCHRYLSVPPIYTDDYGNNYCGRCRSVGFRNHVYEEIAKFINFPCTYKYCSTPVCWGNMEQHEQECLHRTIQCPIENCITLCNISMFQSHFNAFHTELVHMGVLTVTDSVLRNSGRKVFFLVSNGIPAIVLVSDVTTELVNMGIKHKASVGVFCVVKNFDSNIKYSAEFTLDYGHISTTTTLKNKQIQLYHTSTPHMADGLTTMVNVHPSNTRMLRTSLTVNLYNTAEEQQKEETEEVGSVNSSLFNCPICCQFMSSRIFQCINGHSFCENCKNNMVSCPSCRGRFGPRNYLLEDIRRRACPS